jgi:hypothetical protein
MDIGRKSLLPRKWVGLLGVSSMAFRRYIIDNAIKYNSERKTVWVEALQREKKPLSACVIRAAE